MNPPIVAAAVMASQIPVIGSSQIIAAREVAVMSQPGRPETKPTAAAITGPPVSPARALSPVEMAAVRTASVVSVMGLFPFWC